MALYHYKVKVGIFVASVQAENWQEAVEKCIKADIFDKNSPTEKVKCIEVRRIRGVKDGS